LINNKFKNTKPMEKIKLEIRGAEGGTDAKLLVCEMKDIYTKAANINNIA
jgi:protein subunit release factor A